MKVEEGIVGIEKIEEVILEDDSIEEYMKEIKESVKVAKKALIKFNKNDEICSEGIKIDSKNPIYQAIKATPISELDYII